jgi:hypothetical protein
MKKNVSSKSKKRTKPFSAIKKQDAPLNIGVLNDVVFPTSKNPSTESDTSDSSSDEGNERPSRIERDAMGSSKSQIIDLDFLKSRGSTHLPTPTTPKACDESSEKHFVWFSHGKFWTVFGILVAWTGLVCAVEARNTTSFVTVESPIYVDASFNEVNDVGMLNFMLCFNETTTGLSGCSLHELDVNDVNDQMFQIARSMAFISVMMGGFLASCMTLSMVWHSINLRPVGIGFLLTYFFQSFTFLIFDTKLCGKHTCHVSEGTVYSIVAGFCWILACIASSKMDGFKFQQKKARERAHRSAGPSKPSKLDRGISDVTKETEASYDSSSPTDDVETPKRSGGCFRALLRDLEDSEDWRAGPRTSRPRETGPRTSRSQETKTQDKPKRRGRSLSSKQGTRYSSENRSRGDSLDLQGKRSASLSRRVQGDRSSPKTLIKPGESATGRRHGKKAKPRSWEKESPGRKAIRAHSQNRSKKLDPRQFEL